MKCSKLLPPGLVAALCDGPAEAALAALATASETPERVWNRSMQRTAAEEVAHLASAARAHQVRRLWVVEEVGVLFPPSCSPNSSAILCACSACDCSCRHNC